MARLINLFLNQRRTKTFLNFIAAIVVLPTAFHLPLLASDSIFCRVKYDDHIEYTSIFPGDRNQTDQYELRIKKMDGEIKIAVCFSSAERADAVHNLRIKRLDDKDAGRVVNTFTDLSFRHPPPPPPTREGCVWVSNDQNGFHSFIEHTCQSVGALNVKACFPQPADGVSWPCTAGFHSVLLNAYGDKTTVPTIRHGDNPTASNPGPGYLAACEAPFVPIKLRFPGDGGGLFNYECGEDEPAKTETRNSVKNSTWGQSESCCGSAIRISTLRFGSGNSVSLSVELLSHEANGSRNSQRRGTWEQDGSTVTIHWEGGGQGVYTYIVKGDNGVPNLKDKSDVFIME